MLSYENIYQFIVTKYKGVANAFYSINDDTLQEHLINYLFDKNFIVLMEDKGNPEIYLGVSSVVKGVSRYGKVERGFARVPDMRYSTQQVRFNEKNSAVVYTNQNKLSLHTNIDELLTEIASILFYEQNNLRLSNIGAIIEATPSSADKMRSIISDQVLMPKSLIVLDDKERLSNDLVKHDLDIPYRATEYQNSFMFYHNQILEFLGVNFTPHEKKERLVTNEVDSNNELTQSVNESFIDHIQRAFDNYNKIYSTDLKIEQRVKKEEIAPVQEKEVKQDEL